MSMGERDILFVVAEILAEHRVAALKQVSLQMNLGGLCVDPSTMRGVMRDVYGRFGMASPNSVASEPVVFQTVGDLVAWIQASTD